MTFATQDVTSSSTVPDRRGNTPASTEFARMSDRMCELEGLISHLEDRLEAVLRASIPTPNNPHTEVRPPASISPLVETLQMLNARLNRANERLQELVDRLEV